MRKIVPSQYYASPESAELLDTLEWLLRITAIAPAAETMEDARGVGKSSDLSLYADDYGTDESADDIRVKMRQNGIVNRALIQSVCDGFQQTEAEIVEDKRGFGVQIYLTTKLSPEELESLFEQLRLIVPAHYVIGLTVVSKTVSRLACSQSGGAFVYTHVTSSLIE